MTVYSNKTIPYADTYVIYIAEGSILVIFNAFFASLIYCIRHLRHQKEYVIIAWNLIFDSFYGLAHFTAGTYRLSLYYSETCKSHKRLPLLYNYVATLFHFQFSYQLYKSAMETKT